MQFITTLAALLVATGPAVAAPVQARSQTLVPSTTSQYNVWTGAIDYDVTRGKVFKNNGPQPDITTLVTFEFPGDMPPGSMCSFEFYLDDTATLSGSERAQIFTSIKPAGASTVSWPPGNLRDQHVGDIRFVKPGYAVGEATFGLDDPFPCPIGQTIAGEIVGRWDEVHVEWDVSLAGPRIVY